MGEKTEGIYIRLSKKELEKIKSNASKSNLSTSEYIRKSSLNKKIIVVDDLKDFVKQLRGISSNLNQAMMLANQGRIKVFNLLEIEKLSIMIDDIFKLLIDITKG